MTFTRNSSRRAAGTVSLVAALLLVLQALVFVGPAGALDKSESQECPGSNEGNAPELDGYTIIVKTNVSDSFGDTLTNDDVPADTWVCVKAGNYATGIFQMPEGDWTTPTAWHPQNDGTHTLGISHYITYSPVDTKVCPEGSDHEGEEYTNLDDCNDDDTQVCPEGSDHEGEEYTNLDDCNDDDTQVCPEGSDHEGEEYTNLDDCNDGDTQVCPEGSDHEGEEYTNLDDCNDDEPRRPTP